MSLDLGTLPYFTPLVKDYLTNFERTPIREFFPLAPDAPHEQFRTVIDARLLREKSLPAEHRSTVIAAIRSQHEKLGTLCNATERQLEKLASPDTVAVVTGQQAGMLGGPLYTFYKAFTAVRFAQSLERQFPEFSFVPIFWVETEDHDLEEIASVTVLAADSQVKRITYVPTERGMNPEAPWRKQAGRLLLEAGPLETFFEELRASLSPTEWSAPSLDLFRQCYTPDRTMGEAFTALLLTYFAEDGLLAIDGNTRELKVLEKDLFRREIERTPELSEAIVLQSVKLEESYHAQVKPRSINLFYIDDAGERLAIVEREKGASTEGMREFFLKGSRARFTEPELLATLEAHPERFSPNVVMRPLYQDSLLPTVAYIAGPGEMAYFAQFRPSYAWANLPMPLIRPRLTATIIEERFERIFTKFRITAEDVLTEAHGHNIALFDAMIDSTLGPRFEQSLAEIDRALESLRTNVSSADPSLDGALTNLKGKILTSVRDFESKTIAAERKRHATTKAQLDKLLAAVLPSGELQEREINLVYFLNKYGPGFYTMLKTLLMPVLAEPREHHIIHLLQPAPLSENIARTSEGAERLSAPAN